MVILLPLEIETTEVREAAMVRSTEDKRRLLRQSLRCGEVTVVPRGCSILRPGLMLTGNTVLSGRGNFLCLRRVFLNG